MGGEGHGHGHGGSKPAQHVSQNAKGAAKQLMKDSLFGKVLLLEDVGNANKALIVELFYDLIFVAAMYRLGLLMGDLLTHDNKGQEWHEVMLSFMILWLTWHHANMFLARFKLEKPWDILLFALMALTVYMAVAQAYYIKIYETCDIEGKDSGTYIYKACMYKGDSGQSQVVDYDDSDKYYHYSIESGLRQPRFMTIWGISRIVMALLYAAAAGFNQKHGWKMSAIYATFLTISGFIILLVGNLSDGSPTVVEPIVILIVMLEFAMYPAALVMLEEDEQLSIDVEHNVERAELWAVLVMGETMLTLVQGASEKYDPEYPADQEYYVAVFFGFMIEYMLLEFYSHSLPHGHHGMDTHIYDLSQYGSILYDFLHLLSTLGLFGFGVGLKYTMKYGHYKDGAYLEQHYCFFIVGCLCLAIVGMNAGRYVHEWADFEVCGIKRRNWWLANFLIAGSVVPLALAVSVDEATGAVTGVRATHFLGAIAAIVSLTMIIDGIAQPTKEVKEDFEKFLEETHHITQEGGIPSGVDASKVDAELLQKTTSEAMIADKFRKKGEVKLRFSSKAMNAAREAFHFQVDVEEGGGSGAGTGAGFKRASFARVRQVGLFSLYQENLDLTDPDNTLSNKSLAKQMWKRATMRASIGGSFKRGSIGGGFKMASGQLGNVEETTELKPSASAAGSASGSEPEASSAMRKRTAKVAPAPEPAPAAAAVDDVSEAVAAKVTPTSVEPTVSLPGAANQE